MKKRAFKLLGPGATPVTAIKEGRARAQHAIDSGQMNPIKAEDRDEHVAALKAAIRFCRSRRRDVLACVPEAPPNPMISDAGGTVAVLLPIMILAGMSKAEVQMFGQACEAWASQWEEMTKQIKAFKAP